MKIKVDGRRHRAPYRTGFDAGTRSSWWHPGLRKHGVRYVFKKWKGVRGKAKHKRKLTLTVDYDPITVKAIYRRQRPSEGRRSQA